MTRLELGDLNRDHDDSYNERGEKELKQIHDYKVRLFKADGEVLVYATSRKDGRVFMYWIRLDKVNIDVFQYLYFDEGLYELQPFTDVITLIICGRR